MLAISQDHCLIGLLQLRMKTPRLLKGSEGTSQEGIEEFKAVFENMIDPIFIMDDASTCIHANQAACLLFGVRREELVNKRFLDLVDRSLYWDDLEVGWKEFLKQGHVRGAFRVYRPDGTTREIEYNAKAACLPNRNLWILHDIGDQKRAEQATLEAQEELEERVAQRTVELMAANTFLKAEIADRKRAQEALLNATAEWEQTFNAIPDQLCVMNTNGAIVRANKAMQDRFEPQHGSLLGLDYRICYCGTVNPDQPLPCAAVLSGAPAVVVETRLPTLDGCFRVATYPLFDGRNKQWGAVMIVRDITDKKRTEKALREAEEKYRDIFENAIDGIFQSTPDGKFISANPAMARIFGYDSAEEIVNHRNDIERQHYVEPARRKTFRKLIDENGIVQGFEMQAYRKDGSRIWTSENARAVRDNNGTLLYYEGIVKDITKRKQVEAERVELLRRLVKAQEDEQRRISLELHDQMGQSLAALMLGLKSLKDSSQTEATTQSIQRLQDLTNQIAEEVHTLARELRPTALDDLGLHTALSNYIDEWSQRSEIATEFHSNGLLHKRLASQLETTIYRIIQEALNNVMKHAKAKNVSIILEKRENRVLVIVEDDGVGFDVEALLKIPATNRRLGLLGMEERVALVGGSVSIESTLGVGTTVLAHIPTSQNHLETEAYD